ncbi:TPA: NAD-dependent epimerase/dehydratase family protein [Bacillus luti]
MRIAITGGTGLLGKCFVKYLNEIGDHTPIVLSRNKSRINLDSEVRITNYSITSLKEVLSDVDAVVHLAAQRGASENIQDFNENGYITQNLYEACVEIGIENIVYASTIAVYSNDIPLPWDEENPTSPQTVYGISKMCSEHIGGFYARKYGLKVKNLRFPPIFGVIDQNDKMSKRMINHFMLQAIRKDTLVLHSHSNAQREFLYVKDASRAIFCAVKAHEIGGVFNIGNSELLTNKKVAKYINQAFYNEGNLYVEDSEEDTTESSYMVSLKALNQLGFKAQYSLYEAMKDIYKEMQNV